MRAMFWTPWVLVAHFASSTTALIRARQLAAAKWQLQANSIGMHAPALAAEVEALALQVAQLREDGIDNHATVIRRTEAEMCRISLERVELLHRI